MKIAYKGFDRDLKCRDEQFLVGATYGKMNSNLLNPRLCSSDGYHYCDNLIDVFSLELLNQI